MSLQYITTAIDYPNAAPHMGHVLEKVLADATARWFRLRGDEVRFQIGTDEHGIKIQQTAKTQGITPSQLVEKNVPLFQELYKTLNVSSDVFIRTTDQKRHWPTVQMLWEKLREAGALEKRTYTGLYCSGCERFVTKKDLIDGKCPDHGTPPEEVKEENWFFRLKDKEVFLKKILTDGTYSIVPDYRAEETLTLLKGGLEDVSFSRPKSSLEWGIPVPGEPDQTMYVWCDALTNYISGIDYFKDSSWWSHATVTHVIGKDIARFHALIWPAMLDYAGIKVPDRLLIHGFVTSEGQKMSKSLGNVVNPVDVLAKYPVDALRFFLLSEIPFGRDGDFSWKRFGEIYQSKLGNNIGNLLNRVLVMLNKIDAKISVGPVSVFVNRGADPWSDYYRCMNEFDLWSAIQWAVQWAEQCNKYMNDMAPWKMENEDSKREVLSVLAENLRHISLMLLPFIPESAQRMNKQLGVPYADRMLDKEFVITDQMKQWGGCKDWKQVGEPQILFSPVEVGV